MTETTQGGLGPSVALNFCRFSHVMAVFQFPLKPAI